MKNLFFSIFEGESLHRTQIMPHFGIKWKQNGNEKVKLSDERLNKQKLAQTIEKKNNGRKRVKRCEFAFDGFL